MNDMTQKNKYQLLVLYGKSGVGKDTILNETIEANPNIFHRVVSCTTRPPRDGEVNGKDYYFLTTEEMLDEAIIPNNLLEISKFNHWYYGITLSSLVPDKINIAVLNPEGIANLQKNHTDKLTCREGMESQMSRTDLSTQQGKERVKQTEKAALTYLHYHM